MHICRSWGGLPPPPSPNNPYMGMGLWASGCYAQLHFLPATGSLFVPGYEWVGWKNRSMGPLQLDFTFDTVRVFTKMAIHINNHYSRDIQIFARAKVSKFNNILQISFNIFKNYLNLYIIHTEIPNTFKFKNFSKNAFQLMFYFGSKSNIIFYIQ